MPFLKSGLPALKRMVRAKTSLFGLIAVEGLLALLALAALPADAENARWLGFSTSRLILMAAMLALSAAIGWLAWFPLPRWTARWARRLFSPLWQRPAFILLPAFALANLFIPIILFSLYHSTGDFRYFAYYQRLLPLFIWLGLSSLEGFTWMTFKSRLNVRSLQDQPAVFRAALVFWTAFALLGVLVIFSGLGTRPDQIGWGLPDVPLMEWQIWLAWLVGSAGMWFLMRRRAPRALDVALALSVYLLAVSLWLSQPIQPAFFATSPRAPNYEIYPFSDGAYYNSFAQSLLIGGGFKGQEIPPRPLYISLLALFHFVAGQDYTRVIALQTLFLGLLPVGLYLLGKELHSRPAGVMMALLAVFRELTAIHATPFTDDASNSQLLFADLPAALAIIFWGWLVVRWLKAPRRSLVRALLVGGGMAVVMLFRTQSLVMLPGVLLLYLIIVRFKVRVWAAPVAVVFVGLALGVAPWLARNALVTGQLAFDDVKTQTGVLAQHYSLNGKDLAFSQQPGEDVSSYTDRVNEGITGFILAHPGVVIGFTADHFFHSEIANLLVLPLRGELRSLSELWLPTWAFWEQWTRALSLGDVLLLLLNLGIISVGLGAAWVRSGWAGMALLVMNFSYNFSQSAARKTGWRYLLPVDWVSYTYAAVGLLEISLSVLLLLGAGRGRASWGLSLFSPRFDVPVRPSSKGQPRALALAALGVVLVGCLPLIAEFSVARRYPLEKQAHLAVDIATSPLLPAGMIDRAALDAFARQPGTQVVMGRALYPRAYAAGEGEPLTAKTGYQPEGYARTVFLVTANDYNGLVILPSSQAPAYFPNAADVWVLGCAADGYLDAKLVLMAGSPGAAYLADGGLPSSCPPEPPQTSSVPLAIIDAFPRRLPAVLPVSLVR